MTEPSIYGKTSNDILTVREKINSYNNILNDIKNNIKIHKLNHIKTKFKNQKICYIILNSIIFILILLIVFFKIKIKNKNKK